MSGRRLQSKRHTCWRLVSHANFPAGSPRKVGSRLRPLFGCSSQRQIVPVTTNERENGKRNTVRKTLSPFGL
jgi:hypothetical protein